MTKVERFLVESRTCGIELIPVPHGRTGCELFCASVNNGWLNWKDELYWLTSFGKERADFLIEAKWSKK